MQQILYLGDYSFVYYSVLSLFEGEGMMWNGVRRQVPPQKDTQFAMPATNRTPAVLLQ